MLFTELGALDDVEMVEMNPREKDQDKMSHYCKLQPHGTIPCLDIDGQSPIVESGAICLYLADSYEKLGPGLDKDSYYNWIVYAVATLDEVMEVLNVQWMFTDEAQQDEQLIIKSVRKYQTFARYLTRTLADRDYICGDRFTAADCVLGYNLWWSYMMKDGMLLTDFPVIKQYYEHLSRRSAFQRVFAENGL